MPRSVNAVASKKHRKKILNFAKGFYGARSKLYTVAKNAVEKSFKYSYFGRKNKKRNFRKLWIQRINAAARENGISYSNLIFLIRKNNIKLNRKCLADLAMKNNSSFKKMIKKISKISDSR
ncbi:50S ribosomal protein L20 [Candidatus Karelsulcia muelleri]|uniref:50S ribosomal protein L20 n=1 Tax=Candidatus Karelsulcia muelleri TaxID=336810 RepID=UPI00216B24BF|nr:50S ribosomal protein L20 [Candidatus Karelsulcia muelleri]